MYTREFILKKRISEESLELLHQVCNLPFSEFELKNHFLITFYAKNPSEFDVISQLLNQLKLINSDLKDLEQGINNSKSINLSNVNMDNWKSFLSDIQISKSISIQMPWSDKIDANSILINPSLAFGTGHHQTTQSCIKILCRLKDENFNPQTALDIGTGTGILSFVCGKLFGCKIFAIDNDRNAIDQFNNNLELNKEIEGNYFVSFTSDIDFNKQYDLIIMNISSNYIMKNLEQILNLKNYKYIIISGFIFNDLQSINMCINDYKVKIVKLYSQDDWVTLGLINE